MSRRRDPSEAAVANPVSVATSQLPTAVHEQDTRSGSGSRKRKREGSTTQPEVFDLSEIKTEDEARQDQGFTSSSQTLRGIDRSRGTVQDQAIEVPSDDELSSDRNSQKGKRPMATIDLDGISDPVETIDIGSEDEDDRSLVNLDEFALHEYVGSFNTRAVGIRFYRGRVTTSESVLLRREQQNKYDRNAIQVRNVNGQQVGHLPAPIAAALAPWLDNKVCLVEASVKSKPLVYSIPLTVDVFAHATVASEVPDALARAGIQLVDSKQNRDSKWPNGNVIDLTEIREASTMVNVRQATALLDELTVNAKDLQSMKKAFQPSRLSTKLLDYQLQGLYWMMEKESPRLPEGSNMVQMWQKLKDSSSYFNVATNFKMDTEPVLGPGGLLSDDMGLGKTLQILSLIVAGQECAPDVSSIRQTSKVNYSNTTLVLCPTSLMSNWVDQSLEHVKTSQALRVERYHGKNRSTRKDLERNELVVSTYGTLTSEWKKWSSDKKKKRPTQGLFSVCWKRIVLDEAHRIRNAKSQASLAVHDLVGERRWCLTGTPVVNSYNDLGALIRFVRWTGGIESPELFNSKITRKLLSPGQDVQREAVKLIKILMQDLSLRRRKDLEFGGKKLIELPKITEYHHKMKFQSKEETETYEKLAKQAKGILRSESRQSQVLEILLRMRQACCAKGLISEERLALLEKLNELDTVEFTEENRLLLQNYLSLAIEAGEDCPICLESLSDHLKTPVITYCKHVFCRDCIAASIASKESCPLCRATLKESQLLEIPTQVNIDVDRNTVQFEDGSSTKIDGLMKILEATHRQDASNKTVVFSQWTKLLDMVELRLKKSAAMTFCRIDGSMTLPARDESIKQLQSGGASVMLASLAVASVGLNLTAANAVILLDPWWSPAIEDQAIDRVYRLGQKRQVTVYKMVIENSVEEKVLEIQDRKRKMTATIGAGQSRSEQTQTRRADIEALLGGG